MNASALAESITATRQGDHIRLITYITIVSTQIAWNGELTVLPALSPNDARHGLSGSRSMACTVPQYIRLTSYRERSV